MEISEELAVQFAGNPSTASNGKRLASGGSFTGLSITDDGSLLFGQCKGSGKNPYSCSVDFTNEAAPVARCTCPSRQIPCKHAVGLLMCRALGQPFTVQPVPPEIEAKRKKISAREEKKHAEADNPQPAVMTKTRATAAAKKCQVQVDGLGLAAKLLHNLSLAGLHSVDAQTKTQLTKQAKELGNYYIPGVHASFLELLDLAHTAQQTQQFAEAIDQMNYLHTLIRKGDTYLRSKKADFDAFPDMPQSSTQDMLHSRIEEQLGYAWKLTELRDHDLCRPNEQLVQVSFNSCDDPIRKQFVDEGIWMSLTHGDIVRTLTYRPYRAKGIVEAADSQFDVVETDALYIYPGDLNPRVRWETSQLRPLTSGDIEKVRSYALDDYGLVIRKVRAQIRSLLADKNPLLALVVSTVRRSSEGALTIFDAQGTPIVLRLETFGDLLLRMPASQIEKHILVCQFDHDVNENFLYAIPLALVGHDTILRLAY